MKKIYNNFIFLLKNKNKIKSLEKYPRFLFEDNFSEDLYMNNPNIFIEGDGITWVVFENDIEVFSALRNEEILVIEFCRYNYFKDVIRNRKIKELGI